MHVGVRVGSIIDEVGTPAFFNAAFSTVSVLLEDGQPGKRFPVFSRQLYAGQVPTAQAAALLRELHTIALELQQFSPAQLVWDAEDRSLTPPWGDRIAEHITSLGNYFVTSTGRELWALLIEAAEAAQAEQRDMRVVSY